MIFGFILEQNQSLYENKCEKPQKTSTVQWPEHSLRIWQRAGCKFLLCQTHRGFNWNLLRPTRYANVFQDLRRSKLPQNFVKSSQKQPHICKKNPILTDLVNKNDKCIFQYASPVFVLSVLQVHEIKMLFATCMKMSHTCKLRHLL